MDTTKSIDQDIALEQKIRFWLRAVYVSIAVIVIPPLFGMAGTVFGMVTAFNELDSSGATDPERLSGTISTSLITTAIGLVVSLFGLILLVISLVRWRILRKRA